MFAVAEELYFVLVVLSNWNRVAVAARRLHSLC
jgi:hypothetical protein